MMIPILSEAGVGAIRELVKARALLAFDFDGTLAPIVARRQDAQVQPETRALLRTLAVLQPCVVLSGRCRADVLRRLAGVPLVAVVGNHGAEAAFGPLDRKAERRVASWKGPLGRMLEGALGVEVEDKRFSLAIHYRGAPSWSEAEDRIATATTAVKGARVFAGHAVVNLVPAESPTKGTALRDLCDRVHARTAVYVGDDVTDEEAFGVVQVRYAIRVGAEGTSTATYSLPDQLAVDDLLRAIVRERVRQDGFGDGWERLVGLMAS